MDIWYQAGSDKYIFEHFVTGLTNILQLESESGFEIVTQLVETRQWPTFASFIYALKLGLVTGTATIIVQSQLQLTEIFSCHDFINERLL